MNFIVLVIAAFLMDGTPKTISTVLPAGVECDDAAASALHLQLDHMIGAKTQDNFLYDCKPLESPGPAKHVPGKNEA